MIVSPFASKDFLFILHAPFTFWNKPGSLQKSYEITKKKILHFKLLHLLSPTLSISNSTTLEKF